MHLDRRQFDHRAFVRLMVQHRLPTAAMARRLRVSWQYVNLVTRGVWPGESFRRRLRLAFPGYDCFGGSNA